MALEDMLSIDKSLLISVAGASRLGKVSKNNSMASDLESIFPYTQAVGIPNADVESIARDPLSFSEWARQYEELQIGIVDEMLEKNLGGFDERTLKYLARNYSPEIGSLKAKRKALETVDGPNIAYGMLAAKIDETEDPRIQNIKKIYNSGVARASPQILTAIAGEKIDRTMEIVMIQKLGKPVLDKEGKPTGKFEYDKETAVAYVGQIVADKGMRKRIAYDLRDKYSALEERSGSEE